MKLEFSVSVGFIHKEFVAMHGHTIVKNNHLQFTRKPANRKRKRELESLSLKCIIWNWRGYYTTIFCTNCKAVGNWTSGAQGVCIVIEASVSAVF
jgi:hypothetical protein